MTTRYPLEALLRVREAEVDAAMEALAAARVACDAQAALWERAKAEAAAHLASTQATLARERATPGRSGEDFMTLERYADARRAQHQALLGAAEDAHASLQQAERCAEEKRASLADAQAALEAVEKHREKFHKAQREAAAKKVEQEQDDLTSARWNARHKDEERY